MKQLVLLTALLGPCLGAGVVFKDRVYSTQGWRGLLGTLSSAGSKTAPAPATPPTPTLESTDQATVSSPTSETTDSVVEQDPSPTQDWRRLLKIANITGGGSKSATAPAPKAIDRVAVSFPKTPTVTSPVVVADRRQDLRNNVPRPVGRVDEAEYRSKYMTLMAHKVSFSPVSEMAGPVAEPTKAIVITKEAQRRLEGINKILALYEGQKERLERDWFNSETNMGTYSVDLEAFLDDEEAPGPLYVKEVFVAGLTRQGKWSVPHGENSQLEYMIFPEGATLATFRDRKGIPDKFDPDHSTGAEWAKEWDDLCHLGIFTAFNHKSHKMLIKTAGMPTLVAVMLVKEGKGYSFQVVSAPNDLVEVPVKPGSVIGFVSHELLSSFQNFITTLPTNLTGLRRLGVDVKQSVGDEIFGHSPFFLMRIGWNEELN